MLQLSHFLNYRKRITLFYDYKYIYNGGFGIYFTLPVALFHLKISHSCYEAKWVSIIPSEGVVSLAEGWSNSNNCRLSPPQHMCPVGEASQGGLSWFGRGQVVVRPCAGYVGAVR